MHLESSACPSGMNRAQLNELVVLNDRDHLITCKNAMSMLNGSATRSQTGSLSAEPDIHGETEVHRNTDEMGVKSEDVDEKPDLVAADDESSPDEMDYNYDNSVQSTPTIKRNVSVWSTGINGSLNHESPPPHHGALVSTQHPQCSVCFKISRDMRALQSHLDSPVHDPKIFHRPISFRLGDGERCFQP